MHNNPEAPKTKKGRPDSEVHGPLVCSMCGLLRIDYISGCRHLDPGFAQPCVYLSPFIAPCVSHDYTCCIDSLRTQPADRSCAASSKMESSNFGQDDLRSRRLEVCWCNYSIKRFQVRASGYSGSYCCCWSSSCSSCCSCTCHLSSGSCCCYGSHETHCYC